MASKAERAAFLQLLGEHTRLMKGNGLPLEEAALITTPDEGRLTRTGEDLRMGSYRGWLLLQEQVVVGIAGLVAGGELSSCWLSPAVRGQGLQRALIHLREAEEGWWTVVHEGNKASCRTYKSLGYQELPGPEAGYLRYEKNC